MIILPLKSLKSVIIFSSIAVVAIGIFREIYVYSFGVETILRHLGPLAFDQENTVPAWYSSLLLMTNALTLGATALVIHRRGEKCVFYWGFLSILFLVFSIDEAASFHELMGEPLHKALNTSGVLYFAWVIPASIFVGAFVLAYLPFLIALPRKLAIGMIGAGAIYILGVIGFEMLGAKMISTYGMWSGKYAVAVALEETTEIAGLTVFFVVLCNNLSHRYRLTNIALQGDDG